MEQCTLNRSAEYDCTEMRPRLAFCLPVFFRQMRSIKSLFLVSCISFSFFFIWIQIYKSQDDPPVTERLVQEALKNVARDLRYTDVYRKTNRLPKDLKYILLWTTVDYAPFYYLGTGQRAFLHNNCSIVNCYVTSDRKFFGGDLAKFDAIGFNGRNLDPFDLPHKRSSHQKYIYFNMESAENYPVCDEVFEEYFNWTATYRLDSDIPYPYILIRDSQGKVIGPKVHMDWLDDMEEVDDVFASKVLNKSKAAAWLVSHCTARSHRMDFVSSLQRALEKYKYTVDIYGGCGKLKCPRNQQSYCDKLLSREYYFYMSLENSFSIDYVTEKILTALKHDVVPVVYGGADYSRFLPPGSYIDSGGYDPEQLAFLIHQLIKSPKTYLNFFKWKNHYTYHDPSAVENVCSLCAALNNEPMMKKVSVYNNFRRWWHPTYEDRC